MRCLAGIHACLSQSAQQAEAVGLGEFVAGGSLVESPTFGQQILEEDARRIAMLLCCKRGVRLQRQSGAEREAVCLRQP
jgi:hypothetical protein